MYFQDKIFIVIIQNEKKRKKKLKRFGSRMKSIQMSTDTHTKKYRIVDYRINIEESSMKFKHVKNEFTIVKLYSMEPTQKSSDVYRDQ